MGDLVDMLGVLPPDLGTPQEVAILVDLIDKFARFSPDNFDETFRLCHDVRERSRELTDCLTGAATRYADRATDALTDVNPRILTNFAYVDMASRGVRGGRLLLDQGWRRELWTVAAGGSGTRTSGRGLRHMMQATLDFRIVALAQAWLGLDGPVSAQDHEYLIPVRGRFGWVSRRVAHLLLANAGQPEAIHRDLESLWSYTAHVTNGGHWMSGRCQSVPLSRGARYLASNLAIEPGALAGTPFLELLTTRRSETHPYVIVDDVVLPARGDVALLKIESAVFALIRRTSGKNTAAAALEGVVRDILTRIPGMQVQPQEVYIRVDSQNPGETDVFAVNAKGQAILGEVKAHVTVEGEATTDRSYTEGIAHLADQLRRRSRAFANGADVRLADGTVLQRRRSVEPLTLGVTLHEYSGAPWRSPLFGETPQAAPADAPVLPVVDLQLLAAAMHDADDLWGYLQTRKRVFRTGLAQACDELDILCWYLRRGAAACAAEIAGVEGRYGIVFSPKDVPLAYQVQAEPSGPHELRRRLLALPYAGDW